jgi:exoribonuclease-2
MDATPGEHEWLGVSHYAWASSPLRRFTDLANQRQLAAMLQGAEPAYAREELEAAARDFDTTYEAYNEHQRALERYWCLKFIQQEGIAETGGTVIRDDLVRIDGMPLVLRVVGLPGGTASNERVRVAFGEVDLWETHVLARYAGR